MKEMIRRWIMDDLSPVDPEFRVCSCPYAKKAWMDDRVKVVVCDGDLWDRVADECVNF